MKVFISWSGPRSCQIAEALHRWLPSVLQRLDPWMSSRDLRAGARWSPEIAEQLGTAKVGILCVTPENVTEPWLNFEAGALAKTIESTFVCPYLFGMEPSDVPGGPLSQFQMKRAMKGETLELLETLNAALPEGKLSGQQLGEAFDVWWPKLEIGLSEIPPVRGVVEPARRPDEILAEILLIVRNLQRTAAEGGTPSFVTVTDDEPTRRDAAHHETARLFYDLLKGAPALAENGIRVTAVHYSPREIIVNFVRGMTSYGTTFAHGMPARIAIRDLEMLVGSVIDGLLRQVTRPPPVQP